MQFVLDRRRSRQLLGQGLHLARAFGDFRRDVRLASTSSAKRVVLFGHRRPRRYLTRVDALLRGLDLASQRVELGDERHEPRLERAHVVELVLRVDHLLGRGRRTRS